MPSSGAYVALSTVIPIGLGIAIGYMAFGIRTQGMLRAGTFVLRLLAGLLVVGPFTDWPPYRDYSPLWGTPYETLLLQLSILITASVGFWSGRSKPPLQKVAFGLDDYVPGAVCLVFFHWVLARTAAEQQGPFPTGVGDSLVIGVVNWLVTAAGCFLMSQVMTGALIRSLYKALDEDWIIAEGSPHRRSYLFLAAGVPVVLCIFPSVAVGALLAGVLFRLVMLLLAWRFTDLPPTGVLKMLRYLRQRRRAVGLAGHPLRARA